MERLENFQKNINLKYLYRGFQWNRRDDLICAYGMSKGSVPPSSLRPTWNDFSFSACLQSVPGFASRWLMTPSISADMCGSPSGEVVHLVYDYTSTSSEVFFPKKKRAGQLPIQASFVVSVRQSRSVWQLLVARWNPNPECQLNMFFFSLSFYWIPMVWNGSKPIWTYFRLVMGNNIEKGNRPCLWTGHWKIISCVTQGRWNFQ